MDVERLDELLQSEFDALKSRDLERFEALQPEKSAVLQRLAELAAWATAQEPVPQAWGELHAKLSASRQAHLRNIQLMQRQLQAVHGTLQALQGDKAASVDLYDRLGLPGLAWHAPAERVGQPVYAVRDWIHVMVPGVIDWPIFNLADSWLVIGAGMLLVASLGPTPSGSDQPSPTA